MPKALRVRYSNNLEKYLRLLNVVRRSKKASFQVLKDQMKKNIDSWSTRFLSHEVKKEFIKSNLQVILTYAMTCFLLPKSLCDELESIVARFWWQNSHGKRGLH